jgi:hypothetical protein
MVTTISEDLGLTPIDKPDEQLSYPSKVRDER